MNAAGKFIPANGFHGGFACGKLNLDAVFQRVIEAGAIAKRPVQNQFYGDRSGVIEDPFGHIWTLATHVEDVTPQEMKKRMAAMPGI